MGQGDEEGTRGWGAECFAFALCGGASRFACLCSPHELGTRRGWSRWRDARGLRLDETRRDKLLRQHVFPSSSPRAGGLYLTPLFVFPPVVFGFLLLCLPSPLWLPVGAPPAPALDGRTGKRRLRSAGRGVAQRRWAPRPVAAVAVPQRLWCGGACAPPSAGLSRLWRNSILAGVAWSGRLSREKKGHNGGARPSSNVAPRGSDATAMVTCDPCERPTTTAETCRGVGEGADALPRNRREHRTRASTCLARYRPRDPCPVHHILWAWRRLH
ncbi:uncharacterized protein Tco025E_05910 [Trypanosoma conorhini]|uniref:Uncharacterized protein n=1 Tax=Trypanosoma conorhini TaxID=83891 RepID=A0A3R7LH75_9TRYP|nr:uncharacterized protein Tco025E_05910 [Trypanosoma conorhini]RNF14352.1 hypothetical protein Tco025E_05910 [Trypanosoma conorhini]